MCFRGFFRKVFWNIICDNNYMRNTFGNTAHCGYRRPLIRTRPPTSFISYRLLSAIRVHGIPTVRFVVRTNAGQNFFVVFRPTCETARNTRSARPAVPERLQTKKFGANILPVLSAELSWIFHFFSFSLSFRANISLSHLLKHCCIAVVFVTRKPADRKPAVYISRFVVVSARPRG